MITLHFKRVFRYDPDNRKLRLFRVLWQHGKVGDGKGYSAKLSFALAPILYSRKKSSFGWRFTLFGLQLHHRRAYGGYLI